MGLRPFNGAPHGHACRCLGLHAVHHDPAAGGVALAAQGAIRSSSSRRGAAELRLLPDHFANAASLYHHRLALQAARFHPAIRHHLFDDARRAGRPAHGLPGAVLSRILSVYECRTLGSTVDRAVGDHLPALEYLHQTMAQAARTRAWGRVTSWIIPLPSNASFAASPSPLC